MMLVFISDLHLTDGTSGETIHAGAFRVFRARLSDLVYDASWRDDKTFTPVDRCTLVLLGDILDVIRSSTWLEGDSRPWDAGTQPDAVFERVSAITRGILKHNEESLAIVRELRDRGVEISPPPQWSGESPLRIPVDVYYMVGNHDWFYHLPGEDYDALRDGVIEGMGLSNSRGERFPHDVDEQGGTASTLREVFAQHEVYARHGDIFDPFNYEEHPDGRDGSSLGDAIVVELLNRFAVAVDQELADVLPRRTLDGLKEIDNVRPLQDIPNWIEGLLEETLPDKGDRRRVKEVWDRLADEFLSLEFVRARDKPFRPDDVDVLQATLKLSKGLSVGTVGTAVRWLDRRSPVKRGDWWKHAVREKAIRSASARFVLYGHTHVPEFVPLDRSGARGHSQDRFYINTGTWRRLHELAVAHPGELEFLDRNVMTYAAFFSGTERKGRAFEVWNGSLAPPIPSAPTSADGGGVG